MSDFFERRFTHLDTYFCVYLRASYILPALSRPRLPFREMSMRHPLTFPLSLCTLILSRGALLTHFIHYLVCTIEIFCEGLSRLVSYFDFNVSPSTHDPPLSFAVRVTLPTIYCVGEV